MHETTLRVFSALRERAHDADGDDYHTLNEVARDAGLTLDETADALDRLAVVGAIDGTDDDEMAYRPRDVTVGVVADRLAALDAIPAGRRDAVTARLRNGDVEPASLVGLVEALDLGASAADADGDGDADADADADESTDAGPGGVLLGIRDRLSAYLPGGAPP